MVRPRPNLLTDTHAWRLLLDPPPNVRSSLHSAGRLGGTSPNPVSPWGHPSRCHQLGGRARRNRVQVPGHGSPTIGIGVGRRHASQASHSGRASLLEGPRQDLAPQLSTSDGSLLGELLAPPCKIVPR
jgi:hypothetical protein